MKLEKIIDPNKDAIGAAAQTSRPWVSLYGPWIVTGTSSVGEAEAFVAEVLGDFGGEHVED